MKAWTWKAWSFLLLYWVSIFAGFTQNVEPARIFVYCCWGVSVLLSCFLLFCIAGSFKWEIMRKAVASTDLRRDKLQRVVSWVSMVGIIGILLYTNNNNLIYIYVGITAFSNGVCKTTEWFQKILIDAVGYVPQRSTQIQDVAEGEDGVYR